MRTFIAIDIPRSVKKKIEANTRKARSNFPELKWVEPHNLHITLKFLGEVQERRISEIEAGLKEVASKFSPFELQIGPPDSFDAGGAVRVLWLSIEKGGDLLTELANEVENQLARMGFPREKRPFQAHLTIARSRRSGPKVRFSMLNLPRESFPPFTVREIIIYKSTLTPSGPIYEKIKVIGLRK